MRIIVAMFGFHGSHSGLNVCHVQGVPKYEHAHPQTHDKKSQEQLLDARASRTGASDDALPPRACCLGRRCARLHSDVDLNDNMQSMPHTLL
jgi:hypothetical protein